MPQPYIFVYQTICEANGKSYVGVHKTNDLNDGYIGCGVRVGKPSTFSEMNNAFHNAVKKYGAENFKRYILSFYDTYEEALDEERFIVNTSWVKRKDNYNTAIGGKGSPWVGMDEETKKMHIAKQSGSNSVFFGKKAINRRAVIQYDFKGEAIAFFDSVTDAAASIDESPTNIVKSCKGLYSQCGGFVFKYQIYSDKQKEEYEINIKERQRIYDNKGKFKMSSKANDARRGKITRFDYKHSPETIEKLRLAKLGKKRTPHSEETKSKMRKAAIARCDNKKGGVLCP